MISFRGFLAESHADRWPSGHWYNHASGEMHDVSSDGGPGDHMGFLWATEDHNHKKLGVSSQHVSAIRHSLENGEMTDASHEAHMELYKKNTRVIHTARDVGVHTHKFSKGHLRHAQEAVSRLVDQGHIHPKAHVSWDDAHELVHAHLNVPLDRFLAAEHPRDLGPYKR